MPDRIIDHETFGLRTVRKKDLQAVPDRTFRRIEVIDRELFTFGDLHLFAEDIDPRVRGNFVLVVRGRQAAKNERHGDHVLDAIVSISRVIQRSGLIDDPLTAFLRFNNNSLNNGGWNAEPQLFVSCCMLTVYIMRKPQQVTNPSKVDFW